MDRSARKVLSALIVSSQLLTQVVFADAADSVLWNDRPRNVSSVQLAALPSALRTPQGVISQLPTISAALPALASSGGSSRRDMSVNSTVLESVIGSIPSTRGSLRDVYDSKNPSEQPVVLIQDVHLNAEAQTNIAVMLQTLVDQHNAGVIGVEGAFEKMDLSRFRSYGDRNVTLQVTDSLLRNNMLAAPGYVGINSVTEPPLLLGVDDTEHYGANVAAYLSARESAASLRRELARLQARLQSARPKIFSSELLKFDTARADYRHGTLGIGAYVTLLATLEKKHEPIIDQFLEAYQFEKRLDYPQVDRERRRVIEQLTRLSTESEVSALLMDSVAYRAGKISAGRYYENLQRSLRREGVSLVTAPAFADYMRYVTLADALRPDALFTGIDKLESSLVADLAKTDEQKKMAALSLQLLLIEKLADFALTPSEWARYQAAQPSVSLPDATVALLRPFETFYREADIRSRAMLTNLLSTPSAGPRILVTGGFHAPEIAELLKQQHISYVSVAPKITKVEAVGGSAYLTAFSREKSSLDQLFKGEKLFLTPMFVHPEDPRTELRIDVSVRSRLGALASQFAPVLEFVSRKSKAVMVLMNRKNVEPALDQIEPRPSVSTSITVMIVRAWSTLRRWVTPRPLVQPELSEADFLDQAAARIAAGTFSAADVLRLISMQSVSDFSEKQTKIHEHLDAYAAQLSLKNLSDIAAVTSVFANAMQLQAPDSFNAMSFIGAYFYKLVRMSDERGMPNLTSAWKQLFEYYMRWDADPSIANFVGSVTGPLQTVNEIYLRAGVNWAVSFAPSETAAPLKFSPVRSDIRRAAAVKDRVTFHRGWIRDQAAAQARNYVSTYRLHEGAYADLELHTGKPPVIVLIDPHSDVYGQNMPVINDANWAGRAMVNGVASLLIQVLLPPANARDPHDIRFIVRRTGVIDGQVWVLGNTETLSLGSAKDMQRLRSLLDGQEILFSVDSDMMSLRPGGGVDMLEDWNFKDGYHFDAAARTPAYRDRLKLIKDVWNLMPQRPFKVNVVESPGYLNSQYFAGATTIEQNQQRKRELLDVGQAPTSTWFQNFTADITEIVSPRPVPSVEEGAQWILQTGLALLNKDVAALTAVKSLGVETLGKPTFDHEAALLNQLSVWAKDPEFRTQLAKGLKTNGATGLTSEVQIDNFIDVLLALLLTRNVSDGRFDHVLGGVTVGENHVMVFKGNPENDNERRLRNIGLLAALLQSGERSQTKILVDALALDGILGAVQALQAVGLKLGKVDVQVDETLFKQRHIDLGYLGSQYNNPTLIIMPGSMRPDNAPNYVIAFEDLLAPIASLNISNLTDVLRAVLVAA